MRSLLLVLFAGCLAIGLLAFPALADTVTVQSAAWDTERKAYVIKANGDMDPHITRLDSPSRLVIDLPGSKLAVGHIALEGIAGSAVSRVRIGQFQANTTRVVLDLTRAIQIEVSASGGELIIPVGPDSAKASEPVAKVVRTPTIRRVAFAAGALNIDMYPRAPYWSHVRSNEGGHVRYLLVFPRTKVAPGKVGTVAVGANGIQRYTVTQSGDEARIDIEMNQPPTFDVRTVATGWQFATAVAIAQAQATPHPQATPGTAIKTVKRTAKPTPVPRHIKTPAPVAKRRPFVQPQQTAGWSGPTDAPLALRYANGHWQMLLSADGRFRYRTSAVGDDRLYVDIEGGKIALPRDSVYIDNGLIARVRTVVTGDDSTRLTIDLDQPISHSARLLPNGKSLLLGLHRVNKDRVTLDPGHGGSDSGTMGQKGTKEKDVTLAIATKLARMMESNGMAVQMTRMKDLEILLRPRVEMANRSDSDVFVSIHANSFGSQHQVNGIETYYFNDDSAPLARSIHRSLLKSLGRPDRGVRKNNFYVVHHTRMPAALVEIGYLSNAEEEALLTNPAYQERAAQAIYAGIREFLANRKIQH